MIMRMIISLVAWVQCSFVMRILGVRAERRNAFLESRFFKASPCKEPVTWFHASSLGELEMLRPLIEDFHAQGVKVGVSAFSDSALGGLRSLKSIAIFADLSPRENEWKRLFDRFNVKKLILAKYDFWPGLLQAAAKRNAPVLVINAQMRRSLLQIKRLFHVAGEPFPKLHLYANDVVSLGEIEVNLPENTVLHSGVDPRWERIARRKEQPRNPSVSAWGESISRLPKPLGIVGSAWPADLEKLLPSLLRRTDSLVIVPHDLSSANLAKIERQVADSGMSDRILIVDEMGILVELYGCADWAFVGGGFGNGIHSLLEPVSHAIPTAAGPQKFRDFPETRELVQMVAVTRCESTSDISRWLQEQSGIPSPKNLIESKREAYRSLLKQCLETRGMNP